MEENNECIDVLQHKNTNIRVSQDTATKLKKLNPNMSYDNIIKVLLGRSSHKDMMLYNNELLIKKIKEELEKALRNYINY